MAQEDKFNVLTGSPEFRYMLLDRLRQDCLYYLGYGNRNEKNLWAGNVEEQIQLMKDLYNSFKDKPQWISLEEINDLENKMLNDDIQEKLNIIDSDPELGTVYSPDTFEEFKDIIKNNKLKSYDDQISFYLLYDKEFPYGYEFTIQLKDDHFYKLVGHIMNNDSINIYLDDVNKYRIVHNFKGSKNLIDFIQNLMHINGLEYYEVSKGLEIIHNYADKQKSNNTNESIDLLNQLKLINNQINEDNDNKFTKGSFVYYDKAAFLDGYGIITKILDDGTCEVDFKYTKFGAKMETERSGILLKDLKDGNQMIDKQIAKLQSQINTQERIRKNCLDLSNNI